MRARGAGGRLRVGGGPLDGEPGDGAGAAEIIDHLDFAGWPEGSR